MILCNSVCVYYMVLLYILPCGGFVRSDVLKKLIRQDLLTEQCLFCCKGGQYFPTAARTGSKFIHLYFWGPPINVYCSSVFYLPILSLKDFPHKSNRLLSYTMIKHLKSLRRVYAKLFLLHTILKKYLITSLINK